MMLMSSINSLVRPPRALSEFSTKLDPAGAPYELTVARSPFALDLALGDRPAPHTVRHVHCVEFNGGGGGGGGV